MLDQFVDRTNIEALLVLPHRIYARLRRKRSLDLADARLMQSAIALELLLMRPIRRANLVALRLGEHILRVGGRTVVVLSETEVKNGVAHEYALPAESARLLDFYVERLLPLFGDNPSRFLHRFFPHQVHVCAGDFKTGFPAQGLNPRLQVGRRFQPNTIAE